MTRAIALLRGIRALFGHRLVIIFGIVVESTHATCLHNVFLSTDSEGQHRVGIANRFWGIVCGSIQYTKTHFM